LPKKKPVYEKLEFVDDLIVKCPRCKIEYSMPEEHKCTSCGKIYTKQDRNFYKITASHMWDSNDKYHPVCQDCFRSFFDEFSRKYRSDETATMICCAMLDVPFYRNLFENVVQNNSRFNLGLYLRQLGNKQFANKTFQLSIVNGELTKDSDEIRVEKELKWSDSDMRNMKFVLATAGYDPFLESELEDKDRKYCFNVLAGYCGIEGIQDDSHKLQAAIRIAYLQLQCNKLEESLNSTLIGVIDEKKVQTLISSKKALLETINKLAKENSISSSSVESGRKGAGTLSEKINELAKNDYEAIKVNLFDVKTSEAMRQIADLSNRSIMNELTFDANDYTDIVKDQREIIGKQEEELLNLQEENRLLKIKLQNGNKKVV
jgi:phage FluMu protein Com